MHKPGAEDEQEVPNDDDARWRIATTHYYFQGSANLTCAAFHAPSNLMVAGFSNGLFTIHELPDFSELQTLR